MAVTEDNTNSKALIIRDKSNLDEDLNLAKISLKKSEELNNLDGMAIDYNNIGQILKEKGELDQALDYAKLALTIDEKSKDMFQVALDYFNLASICNLKQNNEEELFYLKKIKQLLDKVPEYSKMEYIIKRINELENKS